MTAVATLIGFVPPRRSPGNIVASVHRFWADAIGSLIAFFAQADRANGARVPTNDLIRSFQRGDAEAFEALYDRYKNYVYRVALFSTRHSGEAEEAVQETFVDVLRALPRYRVEGPARFETWLYRVTVNRCRSRMRRKRIPTADWEDISERLEAIPSTNPSHDPEGTIVSGERAASLWEAVDQLPDTHRLVILMRYQQELAYDEIAEALNISAGTVKSRLYHAHRKLKDLLPGQVDAAVED